MTRPARTASRILASRSLRPLGGATLLGVAALAAGCKYGLKPDTSSFGTPGYSTGPAPATCPTAGRAAMLAIDQHDVTIEQGNSTQAPINRVDLTGTVSGLPAGDSIYVLMIPKDTNCSLISVTPAAVGTGTFTATVDMGTNLNFRLVAVATAAARTDLNCDATNDCIQAGTAAPDGISNTILVVLQ